MTKLIGNAKAEPEALAEMRNFRCKECPACKTVEATKGLLAPIPYGDRPEHANNATVECWNKVLADNPCAAKWYAYQNHDLGHPDIGLLRFLAVGPGCTFKVAPERYPDTQHGPGWRYYRVGVVVLTTGEIEPEG